MTCEDCVGTKNCSVYQSLKDSLKEGKSEIDLVDETTSCRIGYRCTQKMNYDIPYKGE